MSKPSGVTYDLRILAADRIGDDLVISLYGGPSNACGSVRFSFTSSEELEARLDLVRSWITNDVAVAFETTPDNVVIYDQERWLAKKKD